MKKLHRVIIGATLLAFLGTSFAYTTRYTAHHLMTQHEIARFNSGDIVVVGYPNVGHVSLKSQSVKTLFKSPDNRAIGQGTYTPVQGFFGAKELRSTDGRNTSLVAVISTPSR